MRDSFEAQGFAGYPMWQNAAIAGQAADGTDASNDLSYLVLEATGRGDDHPAIRLLPLP